MTYKFGFDQVKNKNFNQSLAVHQNNKKAVKIVLFRATSNNYS